MFYFGFGFSAGSVFWREGGGFPKTKTKKNQKMIFANTPTIARDAIRLAGLRGRADLNGCYGIVLRKCDEFALEVRVGQETIVTRLANLEFVNVHNLPLICDDTIPASHALCREALYLDPSMRKRYTQCVHQAKRVHPCVRHELLSVAGVF